MVTRGYELIVDKIVGVSTMYLVGMTYVIIENGIVKHGM